MTAASAAPHAAEGITATAAPAEIVTTKVVRTWDADNGVWVGSLEEEHHQLPQPLWIFGYGSLCWRPEESWSSYEKRQGFIKGRRRMFAQRSMDHRGTPAAPGLVVTLVPDDHLESLGMRDPSSAPSETFGAVYRVPDDDVQAVLADLDHREKGGYTRCIVDVHCHDRSGGAQEEVLQALLYTGTTDNPNFWLASAADAAAIIARAHGPSGANTEYLFNLATWLRSAGAVDEHVVEIEEVVLSLVVKPEGTALAGAAVTATEDVTAL